MFFGFDDYLFVLVAIAVYLMMIAGVEKSALEWRRPTRPCPSCGRARSQCRCR